MSLLGNLETDALQKLTIDIDFQRITAGLTGIWDRTGMPLPIPHLIPCASGGSVADYIPVSVPDHIEDTDAVG